MLRCDVVEDPLLTLSRFRIGLRPEIRNELAPHMAFSLEQVYQIAIEIERTQKARRAMSQSRDTFRRGTVVTRPATSNTSGLRDSGPSIASRDKGKSPVTTNQNRKPGTTNECFSCGQTGHLSYQCPKKKTLVIEGITEENDEGSPEEEEVYEPVGGSGEEEPVNEDAPLSVMRCILTTPQEGDWRRTSIFQTYSRG